jgi:protein TonB
MKATACLALLSAILSPCILARTQASPSTQKPYEVKLSAGAAEKLVIHKVTPRLNQVEMEARGTTVLVVGIGKKGDVQYARAISGPALHRKPVLDAVRKYKYKPYLLNGKPSEVETTVSVTVSMP